MLVMIYKVTPCHIPEGSNFHSHHHQNLKSHSKACCSDDMNTVFIVFIICNDLRRVSYQISLHHVFLSLHIVRNTQYSHKILFLTNKIFASLAWHGSMFIPLLIALTHSSSCYLKSKLQT